MAMDFVPEKIKKRSGFADDRTFNMYYREVGKTRVLSPEEERELYFKYRKGDEKAKEAIICNCLRSVVKIARKYTRDPDKVKDLISAGNLGILHALQKYDPTYKTRFLSYATYWIKLYIREELYSDGLVFLPRYKQKTLYRIGRIKTKMEVENGEVAEEEVFQKADAEERHFRDIGLGGLSFVSFDSPGKPPVSFSGDRLLFQCMSEQMKEILKKYLSLLCVQESFIIRAYYGFISEPLTLRQIAGVLGITPERVRQIKCQALEKLKKYLKQGLKIENSEPLCA